MSKNLVGLYKTNENTYVKFEFPYNMDIIERLKLFQGFRWNPAKRFWYAPIHNIKELKEIIKEFNFTSTDASLWDEFDKKKKLEDFSVGSSALLSAAPIDIPRMQGVPMPYQWAGIDYLSTMRRTINGDEPGLGKTLETLYATEKIHSVDRVVSYPAIIVVPAPITLNWQKEIKLWMPHRTSHVLTGRSEMEDDFEKICSHDITLVNYNVLSDRIDQLTAFNWKTAIADEAHRLKNPKAKRTKAFRTLANAHSLENIFLLTGTPIKNRNKELWSLICILGLEKEFGGWWNFHHNFCGAHHTGFGLDVQGSTNSERLHELMRAKGFLRRRMIDVRNDMPPTRRVFIPMEINNRKEYESAYADFGSWAKKNGVTWDKKSKEAQLQKLSYLTKIVVDGKISACEEWVRDFLETDEKLIIFANYRSVTKHFAEKFNLPMIIGNMTIEEKTKSENKFQTDPDCKGIVGNIEAMGEGLNLFAGHNVAFLEFAWTPDRHFQCEARARRHGQTENVVSYYLYAVDTIEEDKLNLLDFKQENADTVTDGRVVNESFIKDILLNKMREAENGTGKEKVQTS